MIDWNSVYLAIQNEKGTMVIPFMVIAFIVFIIDILNKKGKTTNKVFWLGRNITNRKWKEKAKQEDKV